MNERFVGQHRHTDLRRIGQRMCTRQRNRQTVMVEVVQHQLGGGNRWNQHTDVDALLTQPQLLLATWLPADAAEPADTAGGSSGSGLAGAIQALPT
jgi:hypothetical protein